ncbi:MAG: glycoside hydrolase family 97 protein [Thermoguttaceae bacterium]|nr:glycoside hydrolase family 97 protein [Thermoguttaceae bacterium]
MNIKHLLLTVAAITALNISVSFASAPQSVVTSPNGAVKIVVTQNESSPTYSVSFNGAAVLNESKTGLKFKDVDPGAGWLFVGTSESSQNETWTNRFGKKSQYVDHYNQITLVYANADMEFRYVFRAYDDAAAFRYEILLKKEQTYVVEEDLTQYSFPADFDVWTSNQGRFYTDQQQFFVKGKLSQIKEDAFDACPVVVETPDFCAAITEAALVDWAGAQFASAKNGSTTLKTRLSPRKDKNGCVVVTKSTPSPWRVVLLGKTPVDLVNNSGAVLNLNPPCQIEDTSWIKPGASAWDWWSNGNKGMNTQTTIDRIDMAAEMGWKYMTIDDPWYCSWKMKNRIGCNIDTLQSTSAVDMPAIIAHAKEKGVGIFLWVESQDLQLCGVEKTFEQYEKWGVAGCKIDHMNADDQETVNWINNTLALAAKYHLMVNFHGIYKPTGIERTYPNLVTVEAVRGNEMGKSSTDSAHTATLPFTRYLCGFGDYTPGGMLNRQPEKYSKTRPTQVVGTRAHELALCVLYDSPITTLCDTPEHYRGAAGVEILRNLPTVWDETTALDGAIGEFFVQTRRTGSVYYAAAITDANARQYKLNLSFLEPGKTYSALIVKDVPDSAKDAEKAAVETIDVTADMTLTIDMVRNGGWVARFTEKD